MEKKTKRFYFFRTLVYIITLSWFACIQTSSKQDNFIALAIIGAFLLFLNIGLYDLNKGFIIDLNINQFKRVWWKYVITRFLIATLILIAILILGRIFNPIVVTLKDKPSEVGLQIIGGIVAGAIGFLSAIFMHHYEQKNKDTEESKDLTVQLWFEIINNKILLENDINNKLLFFRRLESNCWNSVVSSRIYIDGRLKGGVLTLYADMDFYNYIHQLQRLLISQGGANSNPSLSKIINDLKGEPQILLDRLKHYSAILFGEMIKLGYRKEGDWNDHQVDWKQIYEKYKQK